MTKNIYNLRIEFSTAFNKQLKKAPREIKIAFQELLLLFRENTNDPTLRNHPLKEKFAGYRSINITDDWRAVFKERYVGKQRVVTFHMIGTHQQLYG
jgi:addiction module RelE/StbE family toxin